MMYRTLALAPLAVISISSASAQSSQVQIAGSVGAYFPSSREIRDTFGNTLVSWGLSPADIKPGEVGKLTPNFGFITGNKNGNKFLLVPVTMGYEYHFGENGRGYGKSRDAVYYARLEAGASYYDYSLNLAGAHLASKRFAPTGAAELGVILNQSTKLSAKYHFFQKVDGLNFNGLQVQLTFKLFGL